MRGANSGVSQRPVTALFARRSATVAHSGNATAARKTTAEKKTNFSIYNPKRLGYI